MTRELRNIILVASRYVSSPVVTRNSQVLERIFGAKNLEKARITL